MSSAGHPFFVGAHEKEAEGVDYLGMRAINLNMMDRLFPGINNVVSSVRPFSVICWACWRYAQAVDEGSQVASSASFREFLEKIETLFVWSHQQDDDAAGIPNNRQRDSNKETLTFQFKAFARNGSLLDAVQYGPSLKRLNGLDFIYSADEFFKVTVAGTALAKGLDHSLRTRLKPAQYRFLCDTGNFSFSREELKGLVKGWQVDTPSEAERTAFSAQLYRPSEVGKANRDANRSAMLHMVIATIKRKKAAMTADMVRYSLAVDELPQSLLQHAQRQTFENGRRAWQLLQVRQAQRLGLEALFGWMERCLILKGATSVDELVALTVDALRRESTHSVEDNFVQVGYEAYGLNGANIDQLFAAGVSDPRLDIFAAVANVEASVKDRTQNASIATASIALLIQCAVYANAFRNEAFTSDRVDEGPKFRIPLGYWAEMVKEHLDLPLEDFLRKIFETFLISQHLGIAAARSSDEKSRMRLSIEDRGLTSLLVSAKKVLSPVRTQDRLGASLALLGSCGLIEADQPLRFGGLDVRYSA